MRCLERVGDIDRQAEVSCEIQRAAGNPMFQRVAFQVLHGDERFTILFPNVVYRADVRMI
jgi:hypothetical protein